MPEECRIAAAGTLVRFYWAGDRYRHEIDTGGERLTSADTDALESPVYTELHKQDGVVFLSGMSRDRHWSASVERMEHGVRFDVACRAKSDCGPVGECYSTRGSDRTPVIGKAAGDSPPPLIESAPGQLRLLCETSADAGPTTLRFGYEVVRPQSSWMLDGRGTSEKSERT